jgi:hypothetical protein
MANINEAKAANAAAKIKRLFGKGLVFTTPRRHGLSFHGSTIVPHGPQTMGDRSW